MLFSVFLLILCVIDIWYFTRYYAVTFYHPSCQRNIFFYIVYSCTECSIKFNVLLKMQRILFSFHCTKKNWNTRQQHEKYQNSLNSLKSNSNEDNFLVYVLLRTRFCSTQWKFVVRSVIIQANADFQKIKDHFLADMPWFMINTDRIVGGQDGPSPILCQCLS